MVKMHAFCSSTIAALALSAAKCSAMPVESNSPIIRSQLATALSTIAETHLDDRHNTIPPPAPPPSRPRAIATGTWRAPNSQTSVVVTITNQIAGAAVMELLDDACSTVFTHIFIHGDGLILDGHFSWPGPAGTVLRTVNANNHQQTWGVLGAALNAVAQYMRNSHVGAGAAIFSIFDGRHMVGTGSVG